MSDNAELAKYIQMLSAVHTADELPLILGSTKQARNYLRYIGEWEDFQAAAQRGDFSDDFYAWMNSGIGVNQKIEAEDGSFVDVYSMKAPASLFYLVYPLVHLFDKLREGGTPDPSADVGELISMPLSAYRKAINEAENAKAERLNKEYGNLRREVDITKIAVDYLAEACNRGEATV